MKNIARIEIIRENGQPVLKVWLSSDEFKEFFSSNQWDYVESDSNRFVFDGSMDWMYIKTLYTVIADYLSTAPRWSGVVEDIEDDEIYVYKKEDICV